MIAPLPARGAPFLYLPLLVGRSASTAICGRPSVRRDRSVLVSPRDRTERHTAALAGTGGVAAGSPKPTCSQRRARGHLTRARFTRPAFPGVTALACQPDPGRRTLMLECRRGRGRVGDSQSVPGRAWLARADNLGNRQDGRPIAHGADGKVTEILLGPIRPLLAAAV